jgi:hypothetical protein
MGPKAMALAGTVLATMTIGVAAPAFAVPQAAPQAATRAVQQPQPPQEQRERTIVIPPQNRGEGDGIGVDNGVDFEGEPCVQTNEGDVPACLQVPLGIQDQDVRDELGFNACANDESEFCQNLAQQD